MCLSWLNHSEGDVLQLLRLVDVEVCEEGAEELLKVLFRDATGGCPVRIDPTEKLSSEASLYMRVIADFWRSKTDDANAQDAFETQVPELLAICNMMEMNTGNDFVLKQLLLIASMRDFSEEMGRCSLSSLLRSLLPSPQISQFLVEPIIKVLAQCHSDEQEFIQVVLEMVADVREPLDLLQTDEAKIGFQKAIKRRDDMKITYAKLKKIIRISKQKGQMENVAKAERKAVTVRQELEAAEESIATRERLEEHIWYRILCVTELMLENTKQGARHPGLHGLLDGVLMPSMAQSGTVIREKALRCLAMYCLLDRTTNTVQKHIQIILDASQNEELEVRLTAVKSLFDIGMLYGFNCIKEDDLINRLSKYVTDESEDQKMRGMVVEGFAKLYLMGQCHDPDMLGNMLLLFFAPSTGTDVRLRQCLSVFFPTFAFASRANQTLCFNMAVPTLRRILLSDPASSFRKIDWSLFCKFVSHLVDSNNAAYDFVQDASEPSWHEQIIAQMAYEMRAPEKSFGQFWARSLSHFLPRDPHVVDDPESSAVRLRYCAKLYCAVSEAANESTDKRVKQWGEKRAASIRAVVVGGKEKEALTEELMKEVADEMEVEVEEYLEARADVVEAIVDANNNVFQNDNFSNLEKDDSPVARTKKKVTVRKAEVKTKAKPSAQSWGIAMPGVEKKRDRKPVAESTTKSKKKDEDDEDFESPPKKEKTGPPTVRKSARKRKEVAPIVDLDSEEADAEMLDFNGAIEEEVENQEQPQQQQPESPWKRTQDSAGKKTKVLTPTNQ
jgi:hypothetical protein